MKTIRYLLALAFSSVVFSFSAHAGLEQWIQFPKSPGVQTIRHDDIYFIDPTNGWATQVSNIYKTTNGGVTWSTNASFYGAHFRSIAFATTNTGFAGNLGPGSYDGNVTDSNVMYMTTNAGASWSPMPFFAQVGMKGLCSMYVLDSQHVYGAGRVRGPANFIHSTDGGNTWGIYNMSTAGLMTAIMDVYFSDTNNGWLVGQDTNAYTTSPAPPNPAYHGTICHTTNGGLTWQTAFTTPTIYSYFWKISFPSTNVGYCALEQNNPGYSALIYYKTTDGGVTWVSNAVSFSSIGITSGSFYLQGCGFVSETEGWLGGASGLSTYGPSFIHTIDGGVTWSNAGFNDTFFINRIRFMSPHLGFASGANLYIWTNPLVINSGPTSTVVQAGNNLNLSVSASSLTPIGYQWQQNGTNINQTNASITLTNITRLAEGAYSVVLTNTATNAQTTNATIQILAAERLSAPILLPGGGLQLMFNDADGGALLTSNDISSFTVYVSTNLPDWVPLTNALSASNGSIILQDSWTNSAQRFYRVVEHW